MSASSAGLGTRLARLSVAVALLVGAVAVRALALPGGAFACSCLPREPGAPVFSGDEAAVLVGTVGQQQAPGRFAFAVERWFKGGDAPVVTVADGTIIFADGTTSIDTCGVTLAAGQHLIMAASIDEGVLRPALCLPHGIVEDAEGQQLLAAAISTFGEGAPPGGNPDPEVRPDPAVDLGTVALVVLAAIVLLALTAILLAIARRGPRSETPS